MSRITLAARTETEPQVTMPEEIKYKTLIYQHEGGKMEKDTSHPCRSNQRTVPPYSTW